MKKLSIIFCSGGLGGILDIVFGAIQKDEGQKDVEKGNREYDKAYSQIPEEQDSRMLNSRDMIDRKRKSYETGSASAMISDNLSSQFSTGAYNIANLSGGNTGSVMSAILSLGQGVNETYNKSLANNEQIGNQLLGLEAEQDNKITNRTDGIKKMKADFNVFRGSQDLTQGYSKMKAGDEDIQNGVQSMASSIEGGMSGMGGGMMGGGGGASGGSMGGMLGGIIGG